MKHLFMRYLLASSLLTIGMPLWAEDFRVGFINTDRIFREANTSMTLLNGDHRQVIVLFQVPGEAGQVRGLLTSDLSNATITELLARYELALK